MKQALSAILFIALFHFSLFAETTERFDILRCEHLVTPLGIDVSSPRLNWRLPVGVNVQKACRVVVGTDSARVASGFGDSWESGRKATADVIAFLPGGNFGLIRATSGKCMSGTVMIRCMKVV